MNSRISWLALVWMLAASIPTVVSGAGFWALNISVDGKPAFTGGIMGHSDHEAIDIFRRLADASLELERDSYLDADITGDVTLEGDIVFKLDGLPPVHMDRIRLVCIRSTTRDRGGTYAGGCRRWQLHADDAADIIAYFESIEASERAKIKERTIAWRRKVKAEAKETKNRVNASDFVLGIVLTTCLGTAVGFTYWYWRGRKHS